MDISMDIHIHGKPEYMDAVSLIEPVRIEIQILGLQVYTFLKYVNARLCYRVGLPVYRLRI